MSSSHTRCPRDVLVVRLLSALARALMYTMTSVVAQLRSNSSSPRKASLVNAHWTFTQSTSTAQLERNTLNTPLAAFLRLNLSLPPFPSMNTSTLRLWKFPRPLHRCMSTTPRQSGRLLRPLCRFKNMNTLRPGRLPRPLRRCMSINTHRSGRFPLRLPQSMSIISQLLL